MNFTEYGMGSEVSTLGDVCVHTAMEFSCWIFTGRRPTHDSFKDNLDLHNFVKMALRSKVMEIGLINYT